MKPELEKRCLDFLAAREVVKKAYRAKDEVSPVCANILCAGGVEPDVVSLKECREILRNGTKSLPKFRGKNLPILSCMLALTDNPEEKLTKAAENYRLLKGSFKATEYLALVSFLLAGPPENILTEETAARAKELFRRMNKEHPVLTNDTDSVFAVLMSFSGKTEDELLAGQELGYKTLKARFPDGDAQTVSQILSVSAGSPEETARRVLDLYDSLLKAEVKYSRSHELCPLAALSQADVSVSVLTEEIKEVFDYLKQQKPYSGLSSGNAEQRALHAVMIVSGLYTVTDQVNSAATAVALDNLFAKAAASRVSFALNLLQFAAKALGGSDSTDASIGKGAANDVVKQ